jgi:GT2 family glycosyltransferase
MIASLRHAARAVLRRPPSDWAGSDEARDAISGAGPVEADDRFSIVCFPGARAQESAGRRVLHPAAEDLDFPSVDRLRRDLGLGATVSIVADPSWRGLAERFRAERGWPMVESPPDGAAALPEALAQAFPLLSIVIVTWNNREMNRLCLESLFARTEWPNLEVIVVDNGSSDGTPELLAGLADGHSNLRVIAFEENRGFPAACNAGLAEARGEYLALLNNDTVVTRGWATALIAHLARDRRLGLVGPVTNAISNEARIDVGYGNLGELPAWARAWVRDHDGEALPIPMLAFFCVVMRREVFARVGPLDERFGTGMFEDGDYNRRIRAAGWEVRCARDAFVHHWQKASFRRLGKDAYFRLFEENRKKYDEKWGKG